MKPLPLPAMEAVRFRCHAPLPLQTVKKPAPTSPAPPPSSVAPSSTPTEKPDYAPSNLAPPTVQSPTRSFSKRIKSKLKGRRSREQSHEPTPERDDVATMPGGEAMLEVLTRLQCYQDSLVMQLEVSGRGW